MTGPSTLSSLTLAQARKGLRAKEFSASDLVTCYLDAITDARQLNCYITETPDKALAMAKESDRRLASGDAGDLEGIPIGIKDLFCTRDVLNTAASRILSNFVPTYESTVTENLWRDGALCLGKLNLDEFAMGSSSETSYFGPVINPWRRAGDETPLVPGGSSGGSAAAIAAKIALATIGTDTGGSIRQPAALTGTVGLKPTYGRCSRWGIVAFSSSLDQAGPITRTVEDAAIMLKSMAGHDPKDSTSLNVPVPDYEAALTKDVKGLRVGIPKEYWVDGMPDEIERLWQQGRQWFSDGGAELMDITLPHTKYALPAYYIVNPAEASSNLARYDGVRYGRRVDADDINEMYGKTRAEGFGAEVKRRILIGTYVLSAGYYDAYYLKAQKVRTLIADDFKTAFQRVDVILTPATPSAAFALGDKTEDPLSMYLNDVFTVPANLAGLPGITLPAAISDEGLPLSLQLIGKALDEPTLFQAASFLEQAAQFKAEPANWWSAS